jgi:hypothetical protein
MGEGERFALFGREEVFELVTVGLNEIRIFEQKTGTLGEWCRAPGLEGCPGVLDGYVKIFFPGYGNFV